LYVETNESSADTADEDQYDAMETFLDARYFDWGDEKAHVDPVQDKHRAQKKAVNPDVGGIMHRDVWLAIWRQLYHLPVEVLKQHQQQFNDITAEVYCPPQKLALDEITRGFYGQSREKKYNASKPHKRHFGMG
jgi:hypothetical protein